MQLDVVVITCSMKMAYRYLVLSIFNEVTYLKQMSIFHKALNLIKFDFEITLKSVSETNQY